MKQADAVAGSLARALGWFSVALGLMELTAPRTLAHDLGMQGSENLLRAYGLREIATGIGVLAADDPTPWIWGRVGGDALDLATLGAAMRGANPRQGNLGVAIAAVVGVTVLDLFCAGWLSSGNAPSTTPVRDYSDRHGIRLPQRGQSYVGA